MASLRATSAAAAAAGAVVAALMERAHADSPFRFSSGSSTPADASSSPSSRGFDPEALERAAKALREINSSPYSKQVFLLFYS